MKKSRYSEEQIATALRQVEAELSHTHVWRFIRRKVRKHRPEVGLPRQPMRRHHYLYVRSRYLADPALPHAAEIVSRARHWLHRQPGGAQAGGHGTERIQGSAGVRVHRGAVEGE